MNFSVNFGSGDMPKLNTKKFSSKAAFLWKKTRSLLFFIFLLASVALSGYIWRQSLYGTVWSEEKKQTYLNSQDNRVVFRINDFQKVVTEIQLRKMESQEEFESVKDVFKVY